MNKYESISNEMTLALKAQNKERREVLSSMIDAINKASITKNGRVDITDELVDAALLQEKKTVQEMIDTCPAARTDLIEKYNARMAVINEFAPTIMTELNEIQEYITDTLGLEITKANRGAIMKALKNKADLSTAAQLFK